jgi:predicted RNA methylase
VQQSAAGAESSWPWLDDRFLIPVLPEDPLLYSLSAPAPTSAPAEDGTIASQATAPMDEEDRTMTSGSGEDTALLLETIHQMRSEMACLLGLDEDAASSDDEQSVPKAEATAASTAVPKPASSTDAASTTAAAARLPPKALSEGQYGNADGTASAYFESYAKLSIHEEMLSDAVRTEGYRDAIVRNAHLFAGKTVLDVGCGTGILSMIAARAGAKRVIGVDASDILEHAKRIVAANKLTEQITLVRGTMETIQLPDGIEKVDVIISEWMGYALLYESMLPSVLYARDKFLAPGGILLPSSCQMAISLSEHSRLSFWDDVYGFDMSPLKEMATREAMVEVVPEDKTLSAAHIFRNVDVTKTTDAELDFAVPFSLTATRGGVLHCFIIHFDTVFDMTAAGGLRTSFTTSADAIPTHWKQTALNLKEPLTLAAGDVVSGEVAFSRGLDYKRGYDMTLVFTTPGRTQPVTQLWRME